MKLPSIPYLAEAFTAVLRRFPLVMLSAATGVASAMMLIERILENYEHNIGKMLMTAALGLPLLLSAAIAAEKWRLEGLKKWLPSLCALALLVLYFFTLDIGENEPGATAMIRFAGLSLAVHLLVAYLPYLDETPVEDFWEYNKRLFGNFVVGGFYSGVIFAGLSIAILAVDNGHLFVFIAGIFNTSYFLANFPRQFDGLANENSTYTTAIKNLSKFILIPIVGIYFLILYAYSVKILATWELPQGWVSSLVLGFSVAGIFTYLLNYLLVKFDDSNIVSGFRRWFFYVLLPMVVLLFAGIGRRISDYGVTEERYVVATAGVWLLLVSLYFIISKKDNIKFIPISLSAFALLTVLGPFSTFKVSERSQTGRLEAVLMKNNMLEDGKAVPAKDSLPAADAEDLRSILYYLREYEHFSPAAAWFGLSPDEKSPEWEVLNKILVELKIDKVSSSTNCNAYFAPIQGVAVSGFDTLYKTSAFPDSQGNMDGFIIVESQNAIEWRRSSAAVDTFDLQPYLNMLSEKYECNKGDFKQEDSVTEISGSHYTAKFIAENLSYERGEKLQLKDWNGVILLKKRE
jgi:hypothetical protein